MPLQFREKNMENDRRKKPLPVLQEMAGDRVCREELCVAYLRVLREGCDPVTVSFVALRGNAGETECSEGTKPVIVEIPLACLTAFYAGEMDEVRGCLAGRSVRESASPAERHNGKCPCQGTVARFAGGDMTTEDAMP